MSQQTKRRNSFLPEALENRKMFSTYVVLGSSDGAGSVTPFFGGIYLTSTLRGAINAANAKPDADRIILNPFISGNIALNSALGELSITNPVAIYGFGANHQGIDAHGGSRVLNIAANATVSISGMTITGGKMIGFGGGNIRNAGTLNLRNCAITNGVDDADGAGVWNGGNLSVVGCTFSGNKAGGGGGAIINLGTAAVTNSTFANNSADFGGAIHNIELHTILVSNSTISHNHATTAGGGVAATLTDPATMIPHTKFNNTIIAENTVDAGDGPLGPDCYGLYDPDSSNNLIARVGFAMNFNPATNLLGAIHFTTPPIDAKLAPLGYHGGRTQTMPPMLGSPAIDAGNNALIPAGIVTDQRGFARIAHARVDIGAVEVGSLITPTCGVALSLAQFTPVSIDPIIRWFL